MLVSVFTPSHDPRFLDDCYRSLVAQTYRSWEWVVLLNGDAWNWAPPVPDDRIKVLRGPAGQTGVGAAKRQACAHTVGGILLELDHDDVLTADCLAEVVDAFTRHPEAALVYSDFTQINDDGSPNTSRFNEQMGWRYDEVEIDRVTYLRCHALEATPHNVSYIWYAPNHVRAFRRTSYDLVGGYDASLEVLDDQDLMMRLFRVGEFHRVGKCLYLQRVHLGNTQSDPATNAFIQQQTVALYQQHVEGMFGAWAQRQGLATVTLRTAGMPGSAGTTDDVVLIDPATCALPAGDDSVGLVKASELLQRLPDRARFFNECYRVLAHGGVILTETPSTDGRGAFQDPSHVAFYNENSFWYLTQQALRPSIPTLTARLQIGHVRTYFPTAWHEQTNISYVQASLMAVKDGPRLGGPLLA
jgi:GT2 family glycosyltransferase